MRHPDGFSPRVHFLLRTGARILIFALIVQLLAFDHWHQDVSSVVGVEGTQTHTQHCHGATSGCADSGGIASLTADAALIVLAPSPVLEAVASGGMTPLQALIPSPDDPPRAS